MNAFIQEGGLSEELSSVMLVMVLRKEERGVLGKGSGTLKSHKNSRFVCGTPFFPLPGVPSADRQAGRTQEDLSPFSPHCIALKASIPLTYHAAPRLISVTSSTEGQFFFSLLFHPPLFSSQYKRKPAAFLRCKETQRRKLDFPT